MTARPGSDASTAAIREDGALARVSTAIVRIALLYSVALLAFAIYFHSRWTTPASQVRAYLLPVGMVLFLWFVLRGQATRRIATALTIVPLAVLALATNLAFADSNGRILRSGLRFTSERFKSAVAADLRKQGIRAYPFVTTAETNYGERTRRVGNGQMLPLAGISKVRTVLCSEGGDVVAYDSDEHGFNNPPGLWRPDSVDVVLVGDSFVFGSCVQSRDHFSAIVRRRFPRALSLSALGNGPITELGVVREYVSRLRPRRVLWFFFEGNDMEDLDTEKRYFLRQYLDPSFSQRLAERQISIDSTLEVYADSVIDRTQKGRPLVERMRRLALLRDLRIRWTNASGAEHQTVPDYGILRQVLSEAKQTVEASGGTMTFVYLPEQHRLQRDVAQPLGRIHDLDSIHTNVITLARDLGLPVLDIGPVFASDPDPEAIFWRPRSHYSPYGNRVLGNAVVGYLGQKDEPKVK